MSWLIALLITITAYAEPAVLRWAGDIESGAPFSYKDPNNPDKIIGFEAEIVEALAKELGVQPKFVQNNWEGLIPGLNRGDYDMAINGIEITPDRAQVVNFSQPYWVGGEMLAVRKSENGITKLKDCEGKRVGTLAASLAQRILSQQDFPMAVVTYSEELHAYNDLALGRLDAVFMDETIALYYAKPNEALKLAGEPIGYMEYGIATRKSDSEFSQRIRQALAKLIGNGTIRRIHERWGLWNKATAQHFHQPSTTETAPVAYQDFIKTAYQSRSWEDRLKHYASFLPMLGKAALVTLQISILAMLLAMLVGLITALLRLYAPAPFSWLAVSFVEIWRGTPLLIQLFLIFYGLPHVGIRFDPFLAAIIGLGLNYGACEAENYRAGILAIPKAQMDASQALGLTWFQSMRHVVLPQAMRVVIPPVTNDFIALLKDSSLVSVITMVELTSTYGQLASTYFDYLGIGLLTAAVYFLIGLPFVRLARKFETKLNVHISQRR